MNILLLGPKQDEVISILRQTRNVVRQTILPLSLDDPTLEWAEFIVMFGYRYIVNKAVLERFPNRVINLHISWLPWNRGADPNIWSFIDNTPKGITIHIANDRIDAGPILVQRKVNQESDDTLSSSYKRLTSHLIQLLRETWPDICEGLIQAKPQRGKGSYHSSWDRKKIKHLLAKDWDTPVISLIGAKY